MLSHLTSCLHDRGKYCVFPLQEFDLEIYFHMRWMDQRLSFDNKTEPVVLKSPYLDKIWHPDIYFPNAKSANFHGVLMSNKHAIISPNGAVLFSSR